MGRAIGWIVGGVFGVCALLTAVSGFASGVTVKTIVFRSIVSGITGGGTALLIGLWWLNRNARSIGQNNVTSRIDIEISDDQSAVTEFQPLSVEQIIDEEVRIFPNRK